MAWGEKVLPITLVSIDSSTLTGSYQPFGSFSRPLVQAYISNFSDTDVLVSLDGTNDHWAVPAGEMLDLNIRANSWNQQGGALPASSLFINGSSGTGDIYFGGMYQQ